MQASSLHNALFHKLLMHTECSDVALINRAKNASSVGLCSFCPRYILCALRGWLLLN